MRLAHALWITLACGSVLASGACEIKRTDDGSGGDGAGAGEGAGADGGSGQGGEGGGTCEETSDDCQSCRACAAAGPCEAAVDDCLDDPLCTALDECLAMCGISPDCEEICRSQYATSAEIYDEARSCMDCAVCSERCGAVAVCE